MCHFCYATSLSLIRQLLEDHLNKLRDEANAKDVNEDEAAWDKWDLESEASDSSQSEGWIDVEDNHDLLNISDSEDDGEGNEPEKQDLRPSTLATTKVSSSDKFVRSGTKLTIGRS